MPMARLYRHPTDADPAGDYDVRRVEALAVSLMSVSSAEWPQAPAISWGPDAYRTTFRALWTHDALVVRFDCRDTAPWWSITERDGRLWEEEVVEIFVDPGRAGTRYAEVEVNPANVVCDLRVDAPWPSLASDVHWNWEGLVSRVEPCDPRLRPCSDWSALITLPFAGLASLAPERPITLPPHAGDRWHFNVFRIKRPGGRAEPERDAVYAAWSVPDGPSFHAPDAFRNLVFGR